MKVSGFTFVRNAVIYDYPFRESIKSILPLVDEMIVNIPTSEDDTEKEILKLSDSKIKIFKTDWGGEVPSKGRILSHHTNLALQKCTGDWCFYIQADEVVHENDYNNIRLAMEQNLDDKSINGLLFDYIHFYGSYSCIATSRNWYRREIRIVRNNSKIVSFEDAQGFRYKDNSVIPVASTNAKIYHYGWARPVEAMRIKTTVMDRLHHGSKFDEQNKTLTYNSNTYGLKTFKSSHPQVMQDRIKKQNWSFDFKSKINNKRELRSFFSDLIERIIGVRLFEYRGYKLIKK